MAKDDDPNLDNEDVEMDDDFGDDFEDDDKPVDLESEDAVFGDGGDDDEEEEVIETRPSRRRAAPRKKKELRVAGIPRTRLDKPEFATKAWTKLTKKKKDDDAVEYSIRITLAVDDIIEHKKFGRGYVIALPSVQKAEVLFEDGLRKLVHARG